MVVEGASEPKPLKCNARPSPSQQEQVFEVAASDPPESMSGIQVLILGPCLWGVYSCVALAV